MRYQFAHNITLEEVREAVARANERVETRVFIEADREDHIIFNYAISFPEVFPPVNTGDPKLDREYAILRECRGLTFHKDGRIAARKFHKFFNVGERPETLPTEIDWAQPHLVLTKEDGSMLTPFLAPSYELRWHTKMGDTDVASKVKPFIQANPNYEDCALHAIDLGHTLMFEFCSRAQRIVIDYPEDRMILLAARSNATGEYLSHAKLVEMGEHFGVEVVKAHSTVEDISAFLESTAALLNTEGFIVAFDDGHRVKVKTDEYRTIHRVVSDIASEKAVLKMIAEDKLDDALPLLPEEDREHVLEFARQFHANVALTAALIQRDAQRGLAATTDPKSLADWVHKNADPLHVKLVFRCARSPDTDLREGIMLAIERNLGSGTRIDEVRPLWGGLKWDWGNQINRRMDD
jgi:RNA ligase